MDLDKEEQRQPLRLHSLLDDMSDVEFDPLSVKHPNKKPKLSLLFLFPLILVCSNSIWLWQYWNHWHPEPTLEPVQGNYYNSTTTVQKPFYWNTDFGNPDKSISNDYWAALFPSGGGLVSLEKTWAASQNLPVSKEPENAKDDTHSLYLVAVLHQLHCLTVIRASLYHFREGAEQAKSWAHVTHCLDSIRQSLMCSMDDTLMYTTNGIQYGDGQVHECKDWDALMKWSEENHADVAEAHPPIA